MHIYSHVMCNVHTCACVYPYVHVCIDMHYVHTCLYMCVLTHAHVCMSAVIGFVYVCMCVYAFMSMHMICTVYRCVCLCVYNTHVFMSVICVVCASACAHTCTIVQLCSCVWTVHMCLWVHMFTCVLVCVHLHVHVCYIDVCDSSGACCGRGQGALCLCL